MTTYTPRIERSGTEFTVSTDFTGSNGDSNRTYALQHPNSVIQGMIIQVQGATLQYTLDYTFSSGVITFLNAIYDAFAIVINYNTTPSTSTQTGNTAYATTEELSEFMGMIGETPNPRIKSDTRLLEVVGTGTGSTARFYVDNAYIIAGTYTFYYGATETAALAQSLTETTHYTLDKDLGILTLTTAGMTLVSTNNIYAAYKYNSIGFKDSELQDQLNRAASEIEKRTHNYWCDGTAATPDWKQILDETHEGRGAYNRSYFLKKRPLPDLTTSLSSDAAVGATTLSVTSTDGFPSSGYVNIGGEKITYSTKSTTTLTCTATTVAHSSGDTVYSYVFEASNSLEGITPTWTVLTQGSDYYLDLKTGRVYFSASDLNVTDAQAYELNPPRAVPNRFRGSYIWGNDEIPYDITQLTLMLASKDLLHRVVRKAHSAGLNDFQPGIVNIDEEWIEKKIKEYKLSPMGTTL